MRRFVLFVLICALLSQSVACGTLLYPERRGQTSGKIDPGIAILDGIGLLVFLVPGLIAFAVDFTTGAIYVPGTGNKSADNVQVIGIDPDGLSAAKVEAAVFDATGTLLHLDDPNIQVLRVASEQEMLARLQAADAGDRGHF